MPYSVVQSMVRFSFLPDSIGLALQKLAGAVCFYTPAGTFYYSTASWANAIVFSCIWKKSCIFFPVIDVARITNPAALQ